MSPLGFVRRILGDFSVYFPSHKHTSKEPRMKLRIIAESIEADTKIFYKALIWTGCFIATGAVSPKEARELGFNHGKLTGDDPDTDGSGLTSALSAVVSGLQKPHELLLDQILELPDEEWIKALEYQSKGFVPNMFFDNLQIVDHGFDGYNMLYISFIADVNLEMFRKSQDWSLDTLQSAIEGRPDQHGQSLFDWFKIIKRL